MYKKKLKIVTFKPILLLLTLLFVCLSAFSASAATITTITVKEMAGVSTPHYPLTFGHVFKKGDVTGNVYLNNYPTQTDVKTTYDDGSIRFAVISALVPMTANSDTVLNVNTTGTAASTTPMSKTEILATDVGATIDLTGLSGSGYSGNLQADLRATIDSASSLNYWLKGGVCTEILIDQRLNNSLNATWEVRFYSTGDIRISHTIENVDINYRGNINYAVEIKQGNVTPTSVYTKADFQHNHSSRWRKVFWLGSEPPEVEIHYNLDYLIATGMVMPYDTSVSVSESTIATDYSNWISDDTDIMGNGSIHFYFPTTGGRAEIGIQPKWAADYLLTFDNRYKEIVLGNGNLSGSIPIHFRENDTNLASYGRPVNIDDRVNVALSSGDNIPATIGSTTTPWTADRSHQGSFCYVPYLITGEKYYLDEVLYWGSFDLAYDEYGRSGNGSAQDFSNLIGNDDNSSGIIYDQTRGFAWALRNISDAGIISPDGYADKNYYLEKVDNNIQWAVIGNSQTTKHGMGFVRLPRERENNQHWPYGVDGPWMHDFVVLTLLDMNRKRPDSDLDYLIGVFGAYTIGRFTNHPDFNRYEGAAYWTPVQEKDGNGYFQGLTWADYWAAFADAWSYDSSFPHSDYSRYDYADSYLLISKAVLSQLTELPKGQDAYSFVESQYTHSVLDGNPTWALVPTITLQVLPPFNLRKK